MVNQHRYDPPPPALGEPGRHFAPAAAVTGFARRVLQDGFLRNTASMTASTLVLGLGGLIFWVVASRTYSVAQIGVATSVIAALTLLSSLAAVGWPQLAMRDGSSYARGGQIVMRASSAITVVGTVAVLAVQAVPGHFGIGLAQIGGPVRWAVIVCLATVISSAIGSAAEGALISRHVGHLVLFDSVVGVGVRLGTVRLLSDHGALGILFANALAAAASAATACVFVFTVRITNLAPFALNQVTTRRADCIFVVGAGLPSVISLVPATLLPTVILRTLGAEPAAFFAIGLAISSVVRLVPSIAAQALLAELGRGADPRPMLMRALRLVATVSVAVCLCLIFSSHLLLSFYGSGIAKGAGSILTLLVISGALAGANYLLDGTLLALGELRRFTILNVLGSVVVVALVSIGALHSLNFAGLGFALAELLYAGASWRMLKTSSSWSFVTNFPVHDDC